MPDTLAAVLRGEPDWSALPPDVPANVRTILSRCLAKDRKARFSDISVVQFLLTEADAPRVAARAMDPGFPRSRVAVLAAGVAVAASVAATLITLMLTPSPARLQPMRFAIVPPAAQPLPPTTADRLLAISPDGTHLVYVAGEAIGGGQLMVRAIDQLDAVPLRGAAKVRQPFISPDGRWIGFFESSGGELKKISMTGGPPLSISKLESTEVPRGASWGADDTIVEELKGRVPSNDRNRSRSRPHDSR